MKSFVLGCRLGLSGGVGKICLPTPLLPQTEVATHWPLSSLSRKGMKATLGAQLLGVSPQGVSRTRMEVGVNQQHSNPQRAVIWLPHLLPPGALKYLGRGRSKIALFSTQTLSWGMHQPSHKAVSWQLVELWRYPSLSTYT